MRTGKYRVRRTWFGKCILQEYIDSPSLIGGIVDSSIRICRWEDVLYNNAAPEYRIAQKKDEKREKDA